MTQPPENHSPMAQAAIWISRITTVALEMVLPGVLGSYLDGRWELQFLGIVGFVLGVTVGIWHLLQMTSVEKSQEDKNKSNSAKKSGNQEDNPPKDNRD